MRLKALTQVGKISQFERRTRTQTTKVTCDEVHLNFQCHSLL